MHLPVSEIKKLLKNWHFYKACISSSKDDTELGRKLEKIEKAVSMLDDVSSTIIKKHYFENTEMDIVINLVFMSRPGVYKRLNKALAEVSFLIANGA